MEKLNLVLRRKKWKIAVKLDFLRNVVKLEKGLDTLRKVGKYLEKLEGTGRQERSKPGKITKLKR